jgi:hypothetical protein
VLPDGTYHAIVIDGERDEDGVWLELTVIAGAHKGDVVAVRANDAMLDPIAALGLPARLVVDGGRVSMELEQ